MITKYHSEIIKDWKEFNITEKAEFCKIYNLEVQVDNDSVYAVFDEDCILDFEEFGEELIVSLFEALNIKAGRV